MEKIVNSNQVPTPIESNENKKLKAFKGFNENMTCRGFLFEEGKTYEEKKAILGREGFHACMNPLDCFKYYNPTKSLYHEVGLERARKGEDEVVAKKITIGARLDISAMVKAAVRFVFAWAVWSNNENHATGEYGAASDADDQGVASATGEYGAASATGDMSIASATGDLSAASASGEQSVASVTGYQSAASVDGDCGVAFATGERGAASATGDMGAASATGPWGVASATGDLSVATATNEYGAAFATGWLGDTFVTGPYGAASATGEQGAAISIGFEGMAKAAVGCWITLAEWKINGLEYERVDLQTKKVDGETIKADTWYRLKNGEFVEVK